METDDFEKPPVEAALNNHQGANGVDASHQMADTAVTPNSHPTTPSIENHSETTQPPDHVSGTATENDHQRAAGGGADGAISSHATVEESLVPVPPDGGFGWVIMVASFFCNVIVDGVCFSFGIFYLEFLDYFGASASKTSVVGSVLNGMYLSMGPIVSALANKFGCKAVTITGSILACASYFLSTYSTDVNVLILTYGALGGIGFGLMYLPAIVMVGFYFEKRRAFATGVAVCGSGIGAFVFAPLCERLLTVYSWKGATWIIAGITLNGVVMGALFRPLELRKPRRVVLSRGSQCEEVCNSEKQVGDKEDNGVAVAIVENGSAGGASGKAPVMPVRGTRSDTQPRDFLKARLKGELSANHEADSPGNSLSLQSMHNLSPTGLGDLEKAAYSASCDCIYTSDAEKEALERRVRNYRRPLYRKDIFYSGSVANLKEFQDNNQDVTSYVASVTSVPLDTAGSGDGCLGRCSRMCKSLTDTFREMMDFGLMLNPVFAVYGLSCFLCMAGFFVPFTYLPKAAIEQGISRERAAFLLSIIGIANTIGRVLCGWVSDRPWADALLINNVALMVAGAATVVSPFCVNYTMFGFYGAIFGLGIAVFVSLRSILMVELIGLDKLTNAFGLVTMCQGLSAFIGAPIAGKLYDVTGSFHWSFYSAGAMLFFAGFICLPLRRIARWKERRDAQGDAANRKYKLMASHSNEDNKNS